MTSTSSDYDFLCNNDSKFIRIAVKNSSIHTINIQSDTGRSIDFSGGTNLVETISLTKCFKLTRIEWAENMGVVKRLRIAYADDLPKLDLSNLASLEELSIIDCGNLYEITNLPPSLKMLNIHGAPIETIDLNHNHKLEIINLVTTSDQFKVEANNLSSLQAFSLVSHSELNEDSMMTVSFDNCNSMRTLNVETAYLPAHINLIACQNLVESHIACGPHSRINGLSACVKLDFIYIENPDHVALDAAAKQMIRNTLTTSGTTNIHTAQNIQAIRDIFSAFRPHVLDVKPGTEDIETIIQHNGSSRDRQRACEVMITLLGMPIEPPANNVKNDTIFINREPIEELKSYLGNRSHLIYYITPETDLPILQPQLTNVRRPTLGEDTITEWLENNDNLEPNILMLDEASMQIPSVTKFISTLNPRKNIMIVGGKYYRLTPHHKIIADNKIKPRIESFSKRYGLPITKAERDHFAFATYATNKLLRRANKNPASPLIPLRQLQPIMTRFTQAVKNANIANSANQLMSGKHDVSVSSVPAASRVNVDEPVVAARNSSSASTSTSSLNTQSGHTGNVHPAPDDNENLVSGHAAADAEHNTEAEPFFSRVNEEHITTESTESDMDQERLGIITNAMNTELLAEMRLPAGQHGALQDNDNDEADTLSSAPINVNAMASKHQNEEQAHIIEPAEGKYAQISNPARSAEFENHAGQHARLVNPVDADPLLASARISTEHSASKDSFAAHAKIETEGAAEELILASKDLAEVMKHHATVAASCISEEDAVQVNSAASMLDNTIDKIMSLHARSDTPDSLAIANNLDVAKDLVNAVRRLNLVCDQLGAINRPEYILSSSSSIYAKKTHLSAPEVNRQSTVLLINAINEAQHQFVNDNRAKNLSEGMFGNAFNAGVYHMRLKMLNSLMKSLESNQRLPAHTVDGYLKDIFKDKKLKDALAPYAEAIREHVAAPDAQPKNEK